MDTGGLWKDVDLLHVWKDMSGWPCVWAAKCVAEMLEEPEVEGQQRRDTRVVCMSGAANFVSVYRSACHTLKAKHLSVGELRCT